MRVAFVTTEFVTEANYTGGLANYLHRVSLSLIRLGHRPLVVVYSDRDERLARDGIEVHRVRVVPTPSERILNKLTRGRYCFVFQILQISRMLTAKVLELHAREPIAIVQYPQIAGLGIFRPRGIPSVVRLSSYTRLSVAVGDYPQMAPHRLRQQERLEAWGLRRADGIFGPGRGVARAVERDTGKPVEIIETPFVLDTEATDDTPCRDLFRDRRYLLFVGRFTEAKGFVAIADAIEGILARDPDLLFAFVGREVGGYKGAPAFNYLWEKAGRHRGRALCLGTMPHAQLYPIMEGAVAVVAPSLLENFPNVCLEAMAHRRVVVGTRGTSFEQLLVDGVSGFLCEPGNPASLSDAIGKALSLSAEERARMGEKAAERIRALAPEIAVEQLVGYYRRVIDGTGGGKDGRGRGAP